MGDGESARGTERLTKAQVAEGVERGVIAPRHHIEYDSLSTPGLLGRRRPLRAVARSASRHTCAQSARSSSVRVVSNQGSGAFACARVFRGGYTEERLELPRLPCSPDGLLRGLKMTRLRTKDVSAGLSFGRK